MFGEGWVVGENAERVAIEVETGGGAFDDEAGTGAVGNEPMQLGDGELGAEGVGGEVEVREELLGFSQVLGLAEEPGDKLKLGDVVLIFDGGEVLGVAGEVETGDGEAVFVDGVVVERVVISDGRHADDGVVGGLRGGGTEGEGEIARRNDDFFAV